MSTLLRETRRSSEALERAPHDACVERDRGSHRGGYVTAGAALGGPRAQTQQRPSSMRCSRSADATSGHDRAGPHPFQGGIESERDSVGHAVGGFPPWHRARLGDGLPGVRRHPSDGSHRRDWPAAHLRTRRPGRAAVYLEELGGLDRQRALVLLDMRRTGERPADRPRRYRHLHL
jgi:hypothetical protein